MPLRSLKTTRLRYEDLQLLRKVPKSGGGDIAALVQTLIRSQEESKSKIEAAATALTEQVDSLKEKFESLKHNSSGQTGSRWTAFANSGLFFMIIGGVLLLLSFLTMDTARSAFSFIMVVLGVAVLLYGTGTQGMGQFGASDGYKVAIAGGAGVIAFCVAWGIVSYGDKMKTAFGVERKYARVTIEPDDSRGLSNFDGYLPEFSINGIPVPGLRRGNIIELYVPYLESERQQGSELKVAGAILHTEPQTRNKLFGSRVPSVLTVKAAEFVVDALGNDIAVYRPQVPLRIRTVSDAAIETERSNLDDKQAKPAARQNVLLPPPLLPPTDSF